MAQLEKGTTLSSPERKGLVRRERYGLPLPAVYWLAFLIPFAVYIFTLAPGFALGDSGELIAGAATLGIVHPPGYSLFVLTGRLFLALPIPGDIAWRMNLFCALCGAFAVSLFCLLLKRVLRRLSVPDPVSSVSALAAALLFAFSEAWWSQCVVTEVYALQIALVVGLLLALERGRFDLVSLVMGLALIAHPGSAVLIPICVWFGLKRGLPSVSQGLNNLFLFVLGVSPGAYIYLRGTANPWQDWGRIRSVSDAVSHLLRSEYGGLDWDRYAALGWMFKRYFTSVVEQWGILGVLVLLVGLIVLRRWKPSFSDLWLAAFALTGPLAVLLLTGLLSASQRTDFKPFVLISYLFLAGLMSISIARFLPRFPALTLLVAMSLLGLTTTSNGPKVSQAGNSVPEKYLRVLLADIPSDVRIVPFKDATSYALDYAGAVRRLPADIRVDRYVPRSGRTPVSYIENIRGEGTVILTDLVPGTWRLRKRMEPTPLWMIIHDEPLDSVPISAVEELNEIFRDFQDYVQRRSIENPETPDGLMIGTHLVDVALILQEHGQKHKAKALYEKALEWNPFKVEAHLRMADLALDERAFDDARVHIATALKTAPFHAPAYVLRGRMNLAQGEIDEAISDWERARRLDSTSEASRLLLARIYIETGERAAARDALYELLQIDPENIKARKLLSQIRQ